MIELTEKSVEYATGKKDELLINAIAQAYADGYRDGYNDHEEEIPVDLRDNKTEFVDLGLPSGTLWAKEYEKTEEGSLLILPYDKANLLSIPSQDLWEELRDNCVWHEDNKYRNNTWVRVYECVGPNGNRIEFTATGYKCSDNCLYYDFSFFWVKGEISNNQGTATCISGAKYNVTRKYENLFTGYHLPVRLIRSK